MKISPYPKYKPTNVEWLGAVPSHWTVKAIKWESPVLRGASPRPIDDPTYFDDDGEYAWVRISDVTDAGTYLESTEQTLSDLGSACSVKLQPGSLFLSIAGSVGKPCITRIKCCIHDGFVYFPSWKTDPKFLYYIFASGEPYKGLGKMGTQLNLNTDTVGSIVIGLPPESEQQAIVRFLDTKTAQIDALVEKKRQLIAKLKEKRSALIARAVTCGLPPDDTKATGLEPNPKMKDSGVTWLGQIPSHWRANSLKRFWHVTDCKHITADFVDEGIPVASIREVQSRYVDLSSAKQTSDEYYAELIDGGRKPKPGDLIFSRNATVGEVAQVAEWHPPFAMGQDVCLLRKQHEDMSTDFLQAVLRSTVCTTQLENLMVGSTFKRVNVEGIRNLIIPFPPAEEQVKIAAYLNQETAKIDRLISKVEIAVERLIEYRQALITSTVTGKIDVREVSL